MAAVIGDPVRHSLSPAMHNAAFRAVGLDWVYLAFEVPEGGAAAAVAAVRALGVVGLSVTMPHKAAVTAALDRLTPVATALGAVNTVVNRPGGVLEGHNTDGAGFLDALRDDEGFEPAGRRCLVVGAGGAARAVVKALADAGAADVVVVNRTPSRASVAAALTGAVGRVGGIDEVAGADLIVNATPVGMAGVGESAEVRPLDRTATSAEAPGLPVDPADLGPGQLVVDLVYNPPVTALVAAARARGAAATGGLGMLSHQAAHAFRLWTGEDPPLAVMSAAAMAELTS
ncbi:MAG: shikimate dehydrogenase [Acidimicrobiales bacterium]